jgi:hypothetical protein
MAIELPAGTDVAASDIPAELSAQISSVLGTGSEEDSLTPSGVADLSPAVAVDPGKARVITRAERDEMVARAGIGTARSPRNKRVARDQESQEELESFEADQAGGEASAEPQGEEIDTDAPTGEELPSIPALDPALRLAALQGGMGNDEIDALYEFNPVIALKTFGNMAGGSRQQAQQPAPVAPQPGTVEHLLLPENLQKFEAENGKPITDVVKAMAAKLQRFEQMEQRIQRREQQDLAREVDAVTDEIGKNFPKLLGTNAAALSQAQAAKRNELYGLAGAIRNGILSQGKPDIGVRAAISQASLILTAGQAKAQATADVRGQMRRRAARITARPTNRESRSTQPGEKSERAAMMAVQDWNYEH